VRRDRRLIGHYGLRLISNAMPAETIYEGPAHDATFHVPSAGIVRVGVSDPRASGYVRSASGFLGRVKPGARLFFIDRVLILCDPKLMVRVSIVFQPH
jgi:hypothetical protein